MKLSNINSNFKSVLSEIRNHKEYDHLTRILELDIKRRVVLGMMGDDNVIHSIDLSPSEMRYGCSQYELCIINTTTNDIGEFAGSINSIKTIIGMNSIYVPTGDMSEPHITISDGYTNIHVFKNDIVCVDVVDENVSIWADFSMMDSDIKLPVNSEMFLEFGENEYYKIKLLCMTMNNMVSDLIKEYEDGEHELY